jgi:3',5'-cyclic AMP phosphodiesterase CpdA
MLRRSILLLLLVGLPALPAPPDPSIDFIHLTDTHVVELAGVAPPLVAARQHFRGTGDALALFLASPPGNRPDFFLVTGDLIDAFRFTGIDGSSVDGQVGRFKKAVVQSVAPLYLALGNHDVMHYRLNERAERDSDQSVAGEARAAWAGAFECSRRGTWYSFSRQVGPTRYHFLVLDNGYQGGIAPEQLHWIRREVQAAKDAVMVVALHIPLANDANSRAIKTALTSAGNIALVLAGHRHTNGVEEILIGEDKAVQVRTGAFGYDVKNWRRVSLRPDRIEVSAPGKPEQIETSLPVLVSVPVQ